MLIVCQVVVQINEIYWFGELNVQLQKCLFEYEFGLVIISFGQQLMVLCEVNEQLIIVVICVWIFDKILCVVYCECEYFVCECDLVLCCLCVVSGELLN